MGKKRATAIKRTAPAIAEDRLVDELVRIANIEEKVESKRTEASFFIVLNESTKAKLLRLLIEAGEHYRALINAVDGLERLKDKYKERFLKAPPFKFGGETEKEVLENQVSVEKSMAIIYKTILKLLDELSDKAEIKREGVRVIPNKVESVVKVILASEKEHVATIEEIFSLFKEAHLEMFPKF